MQPMVHGSIIIPGLGFICIVGLTSNQKIIGYFCDLSFSKNLVPSKFVTLQWKSTYLRIFGQHKFVLVKEKVHNIGWMEGNNRSGKSSQLGEYYQHIL